MNITIPKEKLEALVSRFFFLAWSACAPAGTTASIGEKEVLERALHGDDNLVHAEPVTLHISGMAYADILYGRKLGISIQWTYLVPLDKNEVEIEVSDQSLKSWHPMSKTYESPSEILSAAMKELNL